MLKKAEKMCLIDCLEMETLLNKKIILLKDEYNDFIHYKKKIYNNMALYPKGFVQRLFEREVISSDLQL